MHVDLGSKVCIPYGSRIQGIDPHVDPGVPGPRTRGFKQAHQRGVRYGPDSHIAGSSGASRVKGRAKRPLLLLLLLLLLRLVLLDDLNGGVQGPTGGKALSRLSAFTEKQAGRCRSQGGCGWLVGWQGLGLGLRGGGG